MRTTKLVAVSAMAALLLLPIGTAARSPRHQAEAASPATVFTATVSTKVSTKALTTNVKVGATSVPSGKSVTGYFLSENPTANPTGTTTGWKVLPTTFKLDDLDGSHTIYVWAKTKTSVSARGQAVTLLDRVLPTVSTFGVTPTTTTTRSVPVTFTSTDPGAAASGVLKYAVVNGTTIPTTSSTAWKDVTPTSVQLSAGNGIKTVSAFVRDRAGNVSAAVSDTVTLAVPGPSVDLTMPAYARSTTVAISLDATDGANVGIAGYIVKESSTPPVASATGWKIKPSTFVLSSGQGAKTVYAWVKDSNGTVSGSDSATTILDTTAPTATLTITTVAPATRRTINLSAVGNAGGGSPIVQYALVNGTGAPGGADWKNAPPTTFQLSAGNATKTVSLYVKDAAGNVSVATSKTIVMTIPAPTLTLNVVPANTKNLKVNIAVDTSDPGATGLAGYYLSSTNSTPTATQSGWKSVTTNFDLTGPDGVKTVYGWVKDNNGSVSAVSSDTVRLDTTVPAATITVSNNATVNVSVAITAAADTGGSGVVGYALVIGTTPPDVSDALAWSGTMAGATVNLGVAVQTVTGFVKDAAGNVSGVNVNSSRSVDKR